MAPACAFGIEGEGLSLQGEQGLPFVLETGDILEAGIVSTYNTVTGGQPVYIVGLSHPGMLREKVGTINRGYKANQKYRILERG